MELCEFFNMYPRAALAFSGGVDSSYLLYAAVKCGADVRPYFVNSVLQPEFELRDARRLAEELGTELTVIEFDALSVPEIARNPENRCYFCKTALLSRLAHAASADGYGVILDGTNASDDAADRPGMRALEEAGVLSPLRLCGLTKAEVRRRSREAGLFTWDKPAYACLATRIPAHQPLDAETLRRVGLAEAEMREMGFSDLRVRVFGGAARLQLPEDQLERAVKMHTQIAAALGKYFSAALLDLEGR